jgi:hypothetical protein
MLEASRLMAVNQSTFDSGAFNHPLARPDPIEQNLVVSPCCRRSLADQHLSGYIVSFLSPLIGVLTTPHLTGSQPAKI